MAPIPTDPICLQELAGEAWEGWRLHAGLLHHPTWRRGFDGRELAAMWYQCQLVRELERNVRDLRSELAQAIEETHHAQRRAWWYRSQLSLESRMGMMLAHVTATEK